MSSIIHAERPQNFFCKAKNRMVRLLRDLVRPLLREPPVGVGLVRPASRFDPRVASVSSAVLGGVGGALYRFRRHESPSRTMSKAGPLECVQGRLCLRMSTVDGDDAIDFCMFVLLAAGPKPARRVSRRGWRRACRSSWSCKRLLRRLRRRRTARAAVETSRRPATRATAAGWCFNRDRHRCGQLSSLENGAAEGLRAGAAIGALSERFAGAFALGSVGIGAIGGGVALGTMFGGIAGAIGGSGAPDRRLSKLSKGFGRWQDSPCGRGARFRLRDRADAVVAANGAAFSTSRSSDPRPRCTRQWPIAAPRRQPFRLGGASVAVFHGAEASDRAEAVLPPLGRAAGWTIICVVRSTRPRSDRAFVGLCQPLGSAMICSALAGPHVPVEVFLNRGPVLNDPFDDPPLGLYRLLSGEECRVTLHGIPEKTLVGLHPIRHVLCR